MPQQTAAPPVEAVSQKQATQAVSAFKDFIYSGNQQKKNEFLKIYKPEQTNEFVNALDAEFKKQILDDRTLGPMVIAYANAFNCKVYISMTEFIAVVEGIRNLVVANDTTTLEIWKQGPAALRYAKDAQGNPDKESNARADAFVKDFVEPLIRICESNVNSEAQLRINEAAFEAAGRFMALIETVKTQEGKTSTPAELKAKHAEALEIAKGTLAVMAANRANDGSFTPGFIDAFKMALGEQCAECANMVSAFESDRKDKGIDKLAYKDFAEMFDRIPTLFTRLLAPGHMDNYDGTARAFGPNLTNAVHSYLELYARQTEEIASVQSLNKRLGEVRQFVVTRGLGQFVATDTKEPLQSVIDDWQKRLDANPNREQRSKLNSGIPDIATLEDIEINMIINRRRARAVLDGNNDYYRTIGTQRWVPKLNAIVASVNNYVNDPMTGEFAKGLLKKEGMDNMPLQLGELADLVQQMDMETVATLKTLDRLLVTTPIDREQTRLDAITRIFDRLDGSINTLTGKMKAFYPGADGNALRASVAERFMIPFVVPVAGMDPVTALRARYEAMAKDRAFLEFRGRFASDITDYISALNTLKTASPGETFLKASRLEEAMKARALFLGLAGDTEMKRLLPEINKLLAAGNDTELRSLLKGIGVKPEDVKNLLAKENKKQLDITDVAKLQFENSNQTAAVRLEYAYGIYTLLNQHYGKNWARILPGKPAEMAKVCAMIDGLSSLPAPYASNVLGKIGTNLLKNYDDVSIGILATSIAESSQIFLGGDHYHLLIEYYNTLPRNIDRMFPDITAVQAERREPPGYDVRIRTPAEDPNFDLFVPGADMSVQVPKRIYSGVSVRGILRLATAPEVVEAPAAVPDFMERMSNFMDKYMVEGNVNLPLPYIRIPMLIHNIGLLAPDKLPPVGEMLSFDITGNMDINSIYTATQIGKESSATTTINAAQNFVREGATTVARESYRITKGTGMDASQAGIIEIQNLLVNRTHAPVPPKVLQSFYDQNPGLKDKLDKLGANDQAREKLYELLTSTKFTDVTEYRNAGITVGRGDKVTPGQGILTDVPVYPRLDAGDKVTLGPDSMQWLQDYVRQAGAAGTPKQLRVSQRSYNVNTMSFDFEQKGSLLQTIGTVFSGTAPKGAESFVLFRRDEAPGKEVSLTAHLYKRGPNGSFILSDAATIPKDMAQFIYEQAFARPLQKLYGQARGQPKSGDFVAQMDGAVLFSGPFTSSYTKWEQFQGAGAAMQILGWGGYADDEQTREGRAAGAFGHFMPDKRAFWVGRLTGENLRNDEEGKRRFYGELTYIKSDETEMRGFLGLANNNTWATTQGAIILNRAFDRDYLNMRYGGVGLGRYITSETDEGTETTGGGRIYGVSKDLLGGFIASAIYRNYTKGGETQITSLSTEARAFYDQNPALAGTLNQLGANVQARQKLYQLLTSTNPADIETYTKAGITVDANNKVTLGPNSRQWLQGYVKDADTAQKPKSELTEMLISAGVREAINDQLMLETGAGWDAVVNGKGAGFVQFEWVPEKGNVSNFSLGAYFIQDDKFIPIVGGTIGISSSSSAKTTIEAYTGLGEVRFRTPSGFGFAFGGGKVLGSGGFHAALGIPISKRLMLGAATSFSTDRLNAEAKKLTQQEGITGLIFTVSSESASEKTEEKAGKSGFRLANVFGSLALIHQNEELLRKAYGEAFQWDATAGLNWLTARSNLRGTLGTQYWTASKEDEVRSSYSLTAGMEYRIKTWKGTRFMLINPALNADLAVGSEKAQTATKTTSNVILHFNFGISAGF